MHAMPVLITILCLMAIAYRYYSAFIAAKVAALDDSRITPAERHNDGQNYHPTNKWVLFGHHFAAISGAGPLIGPVLAAQFGYLPGLLWIVIGVCLGGAVQDFLVLSASVRRDGKSLAQIAFLELNKTAGWAAMVAILFIIIVSLAGLGKVVVTALGGEMVRYPAGSVLRIPGGALQPAPKSGRFIYDIPAGTQLLGHDGKKILDFDDGFRLSSAQPLTFLPVPGDTSASAPVQTTLPDLKDTNLAEPARLVPGSPWGTFTIAATIPIALFVGFYMYRLRPGKTIEASVIGGALTIGATVAGAWVAHGRLASLFNLSQIQVIWAMAIYGFVAAVLPVWVLLAPRDYLSSFLKLGTIALLVIGTLIANPKLEAPAFNHVFAHGGPTVGGPIFPFLFITIMCGAISGFHSLVSSGTTSKMLKKESSARMIGYGAMLMEGLVGVVAMIAAATLPVNDYYAMNTKLADMPKYADRILMVGGSGGVEHLGVSNIGEYERLTQESLHGRTGGAVTLAVGMAHIFDHAIGRFTGAKTEGGGAVMQGLWKYWYHFAIMFEALFILTTIDAGTRIGRFLVQEVAGKAYAPLARQNWLPGTLVSTLLITVGWVYFINVNNFSAIWSMFGVCNQMLAVIALAILSAYLVTEGRGRYIWVTGIPMLIVATTTTSAAFELLVGHWNTITTQIHAPHANSAATIANSLLSSGLIVAMLICASIIIVTAARRCWPIISGETAMVSLAGGAVEISGAE